jgi:hypothetical protein
MSRKCSLNESEGLPNGAGLSAAQRLQRWIHGTEKILSGRIKPMTIPTTATTASAGTPAESPKATTGSPSENAVTEAVTISLDELWDALREVCCGDWWQQARRISLIHRPDLDKAWALMAARAKVKVDAAAAALHKKADEAAAARQKAQQELEDFINCSYD